MRRLLKEERSKPDGERDEARVFALLEEDLGLHREFYWVRTQLARVGYLRPRPNPAPLPPPLKAPTRPPPTHLRAGVRATRVSRNISCNSHTCTFEIVLTPKPKGRLSNASRARLDIGRR